MGRSNKFTRRAFLGGAGVGAGSLFLPSLLPAGGLEPNPRLFFVYSMQGMIYPSWSMRPSGQPEDQDWEFQLNSVSENDWSDNLRPLHRHRSKLVCIDNLALHTALKDITFCAHQLGQKHSLTGSPIIPVAFQTAVSSTPSLDQIIGHAVAQPGQFPTLELTVGGFTEAGVHYDLNNRALHLEPDPRVAWARIFQQGEDSVTYGPYAPKLAGHQVDVLELVSSRYEALRPRMGLADRRKLDIHLDLIRDTQYRLANPIECAAPQDPDTDNIWGGSQQEIYERTLQSNRDLLVAALACNLTPVASLQLTTLPSGFIGLPPLDLHVEYAHNVPHSQQARDVYTEVGRVHAQQFAELLDLMDSIPEGNGSLLDNSLVVWMSEMGDAGHELGRYNVTMAGGMGGRIETGRYIHYANTTPIATTWYGSLSGKSHQHFLVSLAQKMGLDINSVGSQAVEADDGSTLDLTGPLAEL